MIVQGLVVLVSICSVYSQPAGCTNTGGLYECDYGSVSIPISSGSFTSPPAQRIRLTNLGSTLTSAIFNSDFNNLDQTATFDPNFPATLELKCSGNSAVTIGQNAFTYMGHVYDLKIINCQVTAQANAFTNLGTLDRFIIENGTVASFDADALQGVSVEKSASPTHDFPVSTGEIVIRDSRVTSGTFPVTFLYAQTNLVSLTLEGLSMTSLDANLLAYNTNLRYLSLGYNSFSEIPDGILDGLESLAELHLYNTQLDCSCDKLWFYAHAETTKMKIYGDVICSSPSNYENHKASVYYYANCVTIPETCTGGFTLMGACITWLELGLYCMCVVAFIVAIIVLILAILTKRQAAGGPTGNSKGRKGGASRKKPPPKKGAPKGAKMGWN